MAFVEIKKDGKEIIFDYKNIGDTNFNAFRVSKELNKELKYVKTAEIILPKGSIEKLIGRKLTWEDDPVELKRNFR